MMQLRATRGKLPKPELFDQPLVLYCTLGCSFCVMLRRTFERAGIDFVDVDITGDRAARAWLAERTGESSVPQVFLRGRPLGGYSSVSALVRSGALREMLGDAALASA